MGLCRGAGLAVEATGSRLLGAWPGQKTGGGGGDVGAEGWALVGGG